MICKFLKQVGMYEQRSSDHLVSRAFTIVANALNSDISNYTIGTSRDQLLIKLFNYYNIYCNIYCNIQLCLVSVGGYVNSIIERITITIYTINTEPTFRIFEFYYFLNTKYFNKTNEKQLTVLWGFFPVVVCPGSIILKLFAVCFFSLCHLIRASFRLRRFC